MAGKIRSCVFASYLILGFCVFNSAAGQVTEIRGKTMGTTYLVKFASTSSDSAAAKDSASVQDQITKAIEKRLDEINQSMSTYIADSEISRFNRLESTDPFAVSPDFLKVSAKALQLHNLTGGRFDVTVGPLVRFWGFGGGETPKAIPQKDQIQKVLQNVGSSKLAIAKSSITKSVPSLEVDFSAIAKGFAVDEVGAIVARYSENYMVEIGGEVRTAGVNPESQQSWAIGVELPTLDPLSSNPLATNRELAARIELADKALATSGDYRNFVVIEDKRFQHTIDPTSGFPVDQGILSVSVVADDCMTADGLATGMMVLPLDEIKKLSESEKLGVFVIYKDDQGNLGWWNSEQFRGEVLIGTEGNSVATSNSSKSDEKKAANETNPIYLVIGTVVVFGLAISGMAIGVIMSNRELKGSCGGLSAMSENGSGDASPCSLCTKPASECSKRSGQEATESAAAE